MASGPSRKNAEPDQTTARELDQTADFQLPTLASSGDTSRNDKEFADTMPLSSASSSLNDSIVSQQRPSTSGQATSFHYTLGKEIARGGMGAVLEANDELLGRTVAMKVIRDGVGEVDKLRKRFIREATVLARLEHPNIVPIHELGRDRQGQLFYTMKKVEGRTLQAIIDSLGRGNPETIAEYSLDRLLLIFRKICDAMAFAHTHGIIHRDLKPENVMIGAFGEALVMDWGLAKVVQDDLQAKLESASLANLPSELSAIMPVAKTVPVSKLDDLSDSGNLTMDGSVIGSPRYMAPEQAMGRINELDERSDIFSLGGILYCILTLRPPIDGKSVLEILENVRSAVVTPPTHFNVKRQTNPSKKREVTQKNFKADTTASLPHCPKQTIPAALSAVCMKAMSLDPAARYQTVAEFSKEIESYQAGFATSAENASFLGQLSLLIRRHRGIAVAACLATLLIVALSTVFMFQLKAEEQVARNEASRATAEANKAMIAEAKAQDEATAALKAQQLAEASLIKSALSLAEAAEREGNGKLMLEALAEVPESKRSRVWHYLVNQADTSIATIKTDAKTIVGIAPDRSSAGVFVVADSDGWITRMNVRTGERLTRFKTARFNHVRLAVSPDGTRVAIADRTQKNRVAIHRLSDGKEIVAWESGPCVQLFYSPDGKFLAQTSVARFVEPPHDVKVWDADTGKLVWSREELGIGVEAQFSPNGKLIVAVADNGKVHVLSAVDGASIKEYSKPNSTTFALHPDGKWIIIGLSQSGMLAMDLQSGDKLYEIPAREADVVHLAFTPDGRRMISGMPLKDGRQAVDIWDATSGAPRLSLLGASNNAEYSAFYDHRFALHPMSNELVVVGHDTKVWTIRQNDHSIAEGNSGSGTFWTDDKFLSQASLSQHVVLNQLNQNGKHSSVWRSPTDARLGWANLSVNADRTIAFVVSASELGQAIRIRLDGSDVQQLNGFDLVKGQGNRIARVSPNGERFLWSNAYNIQICVSSAIDGKPFVVVDTKSVRKVHDVRWSIDGQEVLGLVTVNAARGASESEERLVVWDANTGQQIRTTTHATPMDVLAISPDGLRFAEGGSDKNVRIRDVATLKVQQEFRVHNGPITGLAWHPTRPILATSSTDRRIRLWDIESEAQLDELHGSDSAPTDLVFSPTGIRIACNDKNFNRIWMPSALHERPNSPTPASGVQGQ